jgi:hypothetical protein
MSATNRSPVRINNDKYETPPDLCDFLVKTLVNGGYIPKLENETGLILEPSAGSGNFVEALYNNISQGWVVHALDIEVTQELIDKCPVTFERNFLEYKGAKYDVIVGNPPFSEAEAHIRHALTLLRPGGVLAYLLRLPTLESKQRIDLWKSFPPEKVYCLAERPSFTGKGTDATAYALFVWRRGYNGLSNLEVVSWK